MLYSYINYFRKSTLFFQNNQLFSNVFYNNNTIHCITNLYPESIIRAFPHYTVNLNRSLENTIYKSKINT